MNRGVLGVIGFTIYITSIYIYITPSDRDFENKHVSLHRSERASSIYLYMSYKHPMQTRIKVILCLLCRRSIVEQERDGHVIRAEEGHGEHARISTRV